MSIISPFVGNRERACLRDRGAGRDCRSAAARMAAARLMFLDVPHRLIDVNLP